MLGKLTYKLFKPFFLKYYYFDQSNKSGFEKMKKVFVDSNGKEYYCVENDFDTPLERIRGIERCVMEISAGLSNEDDKKIREAMKKALGEGKKPNLPMIGWLLVEMDKREDLVLHPNVMFDLLAYKYIREDEDPSVVDVKIHKEKIEQLRKDSMGGLYDFFYKMGLLAYMPYLTKLEKDWSEYYSQSEVKITALNKVLNGYLSEAS
jgi:hypothetical protein